MSLDLSNPLDRLYLETIPCRPSGVADCTNGPTALWAEMEREREKWLMYGLFDAKGEATDEAVA